MLPPILDPRASGWLTLVLAGLALATGLALALGPLDAPAPMTLQSSASPREMRLAAIGREARDRAHADLRARRPRLLTYGYPSAAREGYAALLDERLGVTLDPVAGCMVTTELQVRAEAYNAVTVTYLEERHGPDVLDRLWDEANERHEARRAETNHAAREAEAETAVMLMDALVDSDSDPAEALGEPSSE